MLLVSNKYKNATLCSGQSYVFYVSDMEELPESGHFRKMDAGREIASHICRGLDNCIIKKYTEYDGSVVNAQSIGIVFPMHRWGVSLAVYSFIKSLRIAKNTYVYAVAIGESMSAGVNATFVKRNEILTQFKRIFASKGVDSESNIYIRCIDYVRNTDTTEEYLRIEKNIKKNIESIMSGLMYYSLESVRNGYRSTSDEDFVKNKVVGLEIQLPKERKAERTIRLNNVFLDEDMLSGVRLCRVM